MYALEEGGMFYRVNYDYTEYIHVLCIDALLL